MSKIDFTNGAYLLARSDSGEQVWYRQEFTLVGNAAKTLKDLADAKPKRIKNAWVVGGLPVAVMVSDAHLTCAVRLKELPMNTYFSIRDGKMYPEFDQNDAGTLLMKQVKWQIPESMHLYLAMKALALPNGLYNVDNMFLFAHKKEANGNTGFWRPPLPNIYGDGRLCYGDNISRYGRNLTSVYDAWVKMYDIWLRSDWNSDALPDLTKSRAMFIFNPATAETIPPVNVNDWHLLCQRFNHPVFDEVVG